MDCIKHYLVNFITSNGNGWAIINATNPKLAEDIFKQQTAYECVKVTTVSELRWFGDTMQLVSEGTAITKGNPSIILGTMSPNKTTFNTTGSNKVSPNANTLYLDTRTNILYRWDKGKFIEIVSDMDSLDIDETPKEDSEALITSGGVYDALKEKQGKLTFDNTPTENSTNPVTSGGIYNAIEDIAIASKSFVVTITSTTNNGVTTYHSDKTIAEILAAYQAGQQVIAVDNDSEGGILALTGCTDTAALFEGTLASANQMVGYEITSNGITYTVSELQSELVSGTNIKTVNGVSVLGSGDLSIAEEQLPNKTYAPAEFSGLGRKYLQKNIVDVSGTDKNILTQAMFQDGSGNALTNTIFVVQYDYDLNGGSITIPSGCTLQFDGGSLSNGTLIGAETRIEADFVKIFDNDITISGVWKDTAKPEWFGAKGDATTDDTQPIQKAINSFVVIEMRPFATYLLTDSISLNCENKIDGNFSILKFVLEDSVPCAIKMGASCNICDLRIDLYINTGVNTAAVLFDVDYISQTRTNGKFGRPGQTAQLYPLTNVEILTPVKPDTDYCGTAIKLVAEKSGGLSGMIADTFRIQGNWKYGIYIDANTGTTSEDTGWITSLRFVNGNIASPLIGIYITKTNTNAAHPLTGAYFDKISYQSLLSSTLLNLHNNNVEYRAIKLDCAEEITFNNCYIWDWPTNNINNSRYETPAPIAINPNQVYSPVFCNVGIQYDKLYDFTEDISSNVYRSNLPVVSTRKVPELRFIVNTDPTNQYAVYDILNLPNGRYIIGTTEIANIKAISVYSNLMEIPASGIGYLDKSSFGSIVHLELCCSDGSNRTQRYYYVADISAPNSKSANNSFSLFWHRNVIQLPNQKTSGISGHRPSANYVLVGDKYFDTTLGKPVYVKAISGSTVTWVEANGYTAAANKGATSARPTLAATDTGYTYWDTDLGKMIAWNGSAWVNLDGTALS